MKDISKRNLRMTKHMVIMLIGVGILFGLIFGYLGIKGYLVKKYMLSSSEPAVTVAAMTAKMQPWPSTLKAVGSVRAVQGVDVTTEIPGLVHNVKFKPGSHVKKGDLLVKLNIATEQAQLDALQAQAQLAKSTYKRDKAQYAIQAVSKQVLENDLANLKNLEAQVSEQKTILAKKTIRAPFTGRLGISNVNLGQYVNTGDKIVTLQTLNPIYVDFTLPQQALVKVKKGQDVLILTDAYPDQKFIGKISTIDPKVDPVTRNVQVEATVTNAAELLLPGMFANVEITVGEPVSYLTLPQTAISFNPYGEVAYLIKEEKDEKGKIKLIAKQTFVTVGPTRGDQVAVLKGIEVNDNVVVSGQLKLKNGSVVKINNTLMPANNPSPTPIDG